MKNSFKIIQLLNAFSDVSKTLGFVSAAINFTDGNMVIDAKEFTVQIKVTEKEEENGTDGKTNQDTAN